MAGSPTMEMKLDEMSVQPPGVLSRAGSGVSSTSTDSSSGSSVLSGAPSSLFDRLSISGESTSDRRSSFASSVDSRWAQERRKRESNGGGGLQLDEELEEDDEGGGADDNESDHDEFYDLQTPTVEFGAPPRAVPSSTTTANTSKHPPRSLNERLRDIELLAKSSPAIATSTSSSSLSSPATVRANSDESSRTVLRPPTRNGTSSLSSEGFPWNATSSSTSSSSATSGSGSGHSASMQRVSASSLGTPSAIFSTGLEFEETDNSESDGESSANNARLSTSHRASRMPSHDEVQGSSSRAVADASTSRSYERSSHSHHQHPAAASSNSSTTGNVFGYAIPSSVSSPSSLASAPTSPSLALRVGGGVGGVGVVYHSALPSYPSSRSASNNSTTNNNNARTMSIDAKSISKNRSSGENYRPSSARPSTASSMASSRPWIKDSDASSVLSSSGMSSDGSLQDESGETLSVMSPAAPPPVPFLPTGPQPAGCKIAVDASPPDHFLVIAALPGFSLENITLALKRNGSLHILADRYDDGTSSSSAAAPNRSTSSGNCCGGHFERMVELGEAAIGSKVQAEFDGKRLKVTIAKRLPSGMASSLFNAANSGGGSNFRHPGAPAGAVPSSRKASTSSVSRSSLKNGSSSALASPSLASTAARTASVTSVDARTVASAGQALSKDPSPIHRMSRGGLGN